MDGTGQAKTQTRTDSRTAAPEAADAKTASPKAASPRAVTPKSVTPLQSNLARHIRELFLREGWKEGARISVPDLARRFDVSRTPVAAALDLLLDTGAVIPAPGRGLLVGKIDMQAQPDLPDSPLEQLYERMMSDRARGLLPQEVSEAALIPRYEASRGEVRKVLMRFAAEGLAQRQPGHGWRFANSLDNSRAEQESYEFRIAIECAALRSPWYQVDLALAQSWRRDHARILDSALLPSGDDWFQVNASFHEGLTGFSGNRFLVEAMRQQNNLRRMQEAAGIGELTRDRIEQSCREHMAILDSVLNGDRDWAQALLRRHLQQAATL